MKNIPILNTFAIPRFVYRIDTRPPEVIFKQGFNSWGTNDDFIQHVLGANQDYNLPSNLRSKLISTSSSLISTLRSFVSMLQSEGDSAKHKQYYLYEIRADNSFHSAIRTSHQTFGLLNRESSKLDQDTINLVNYGLDAVFLDYAHQREWVSDGPIKARNIRSVCALAYLDVPLEIIREKVIDDNRNYKFPYIQTVPVENPFYKDKDTTGSGFAAKINSLDEWKKNFKKIDPNIFKLASLKNKLLEVDGYWNVKSSMGMLCPTPTKLLSNKELITTIKTIKDSKIPEDYKIYNYCNIGKTLKPSNALNYHNAVNTHSLENGSPLQLTNLYFSSEDGSIKFKATGKNFSGLFYLSQHEDGDDLSVYYDVFGRITWCKNKNENYSIIPDKWFYMSTTYVMCLTTRLQTINDIKQIWRIQFHKEVIDKDTGEKRWLLRLINAAFPFHVLCVGNDPKRDEIWFVSVNSMEERFHEVFLSVSAKETDASIFMGQKPATELINIDLKWWYAGEGYTFDIKNNKSYVSGIGSNNYLYCLKTHQIYYYDYSNKTYYALKNKRNQATSSWDWVSWVPTSLNEKGGDLSFRWYFVEDPNHNINNLNSYQIRSCLNNDYLRVVATGPIWGGLYTSYADYEKNCVEWFSLSKWANI